MFFFFLDVRERRSCDSRERKWERGFRPSRLAYVFVFFHRQNMLGDKNGGELASFVAENLGCIREVQKAIGFTI